MRHLTGGVSTVQVPGETLRQVIRNLDAAYPGFDELLMEGGLLKPSVAAAINDTMTRQLLQPVGSDDEVHFVPAIGGG